ncbi:hypothetical protein ACFPYI_01355 [Halomarina salina]|uniref:Uncharacterized protein n=1 Tax=Halomarina salina TaxID=1872699 RepID=A0ABD5RI01_9EURY|nr:hypothetical protein [Halomarina salina]
MRPRQFTLPVGFGLLGASYGHPPSVLYNYPDVYGYLVGGLVAALCGTVVWVCTIDTAPSW